MALSHGDPPREAEVIASKWSSARKVAQTTFKSDCKTHAKAAPIKRNDALLDTFPIGVMVFPGSGIQDNLADKARKLGIPVWRLLAVPDGCLLHVLEGLVTLKLRRAERERLSYRTLDVELIGSGYGLHGRVQLDQHIEC